MGDVLGSRVGDVVGDRVCPFRVGARVGLDVGSSESQRLTVVGCDAGFICVVGEGWQFFLCPQLRMMLDQREGSESITQAVSAWHWK